MLFLQCFAKFWFSEAIFSLQRIAFAPIRKLYQTWLLVTHKNGDFCAVSVTKRGCAGSILRVDRHISERFCVTLRRSRTVADVISGSEDWNPLRRTYIFRSEGGVLVHQTFSVIHFDTMFDVCERLVSVLPFLFILHRLASF